MQPPVAPTQRPPGPHLDVDATATSIFVTVLTRGPIPRNEIAQRLGLSAATVSKAVRPLLEAGYLVESDGEVEPAQVLARPGRPVVPLRVVPEREFVIGVKLTGGHAVGVAVDLLANVRSSRRIALAGHGVTEVVAALAKLVEDLRTDVDDLRTDIEGRTGVDGRTDIEGRSGGLGGQVTRVGIGIGGHVDARQGLVRYAPFLEWRDVALAPLLTATVGLPVVIENDVNSLTVAEQWFGAGVDVPSFAVVTIGAGIGCGFVVDGALVHGAHGLAGELGHVPIAMDGPPCRCGNLGCVETLASDAAILSRVRSATGRLDLDLVAALRLAREGDPGAAAAFTGAGDAIGRALSIVANLLNPHRIVLSGEGLAASDLFESAARESFVRHAFGQAVECELVIRPLPDDTWARGAAGVAIQHLFLGLAPGVRDRSSQPGTGVPLR